MLFCVCCGSQLDSNAMLGTAGYFCPQVTVRKIDGSYFLKIKNQISYFGIN
jgi:hypothetical protein